MRNTITLIFLSLSLLFAANSVYAQTGSIDVKGNTVKSEQAALIELTQPGEIQNLAIPDYDGMEGDHVLEIQFYANSGAINGYTSTIVKRNIHLTTPLLAGAKTIRFVDEIYGDVTVSLIFHPGGKLENIGTHAKPIWVSLFEYSASKFSNTKIVKNETPEWKRITAVASISIEDFQTGYKCTLQRSGDRNEVN